MSIITRTTHTGKDDQKSMPLWMIFVTKLDTCLVMAFNMEIKWTVFFFYKESLNPCVSVLAGIVIDFIDGNKNKIPINNMEDKR